MANLRSAIILGTAMAFVASCGLTVPKQERNENQKTSFDKGELEGTFTSVDGPIIDLSAAKQKIQVLMFVSETCLSCRKETQALVQDREMRGIPSNAEFYSIVIGAVREDAIDWRDSLKAAWTVGTDGGDSLFRKYCPEHQTPCVILRNPLSGTKTKLIGEHSISVWEQATGTWSF